MELLWRGRRTDLRSCPGSTFSRGEGSGAGGLTSGAADVNSSEGNLRVGRMQDGSHGC